MDLVIKIWINTKNNRFQVMQQMTATALTELILIMFKVKYFLGIY
jgi:hypothetical protein